MKNSDLKQISKLMDDKLAPIHKTLTEHGKMLESHGQMLEQHGKILGSHDKRFDGIDKKLRSHDTVLESIGKTLKSNGKLLRTLKKDQGTMLEMLDSEQMKQRKRITRIETHLELSPIS
jgi:hypothetical protein